MIRIEQFKEDEHYQILIEWWKAQNWQVMPIHALPTTGVISYKDNKPVAAGFLYDTDSSFAWLEWIVGNPDVDHEDRGEGLDSVINALVTFAELKGKELIMTSSHHERLIERYKEHNFQVTDKGMSILIRSI